MLVRGPGPGPPPGQQRHEGGGREQRDQPVGTPAHGPIVQGLRKRPPTVGHMLRPGVRRASRRRAPRHRLHGRRVVTGGLRPAGARRRAGPPSPGGAHGVADRERPSPPRAASAFSAGGRCATSASSRTRSARGWRPGRRSGARRAGSRSGFDRPRLRRGAAGLPRTRRGLVGRAGRGRAARSTWSRGRVASTRAAPYLAGRRAPRHRRRRARGRGQRVRRRGPARDRAPLVGRAAGRPAGGVRGLRRRGAARHGRRLSTTSAPGTTSPSMSPARTAPPARAWCPWTGSGWATVVPVASVGAARRSRSGPRWCGSAERARDRHRRRPRRHGQRPRVLRRRRAPGRAARQHAVRRLPLRPGRPGRRRPGPAPTDRPGHLGLAAPSPLNRQKFANIRRAAAYGTTRGA